MLHKLIAAVTNRNVARVTLAVVAIGWGIRQLNDIVDERQSEADDLEAKITERIAQLEALDALIASRIDEVPPPVRPVDGHPEVSDADMDAYAGDQA